MTAVLHPDGSTETIAYWGGQTLYTDAAGKKKLQVADALGRLVRVVENPSTTEQQAPSCDTSATATSNICTDYTYDTLGNLTGVTQGSQTRTFVYNWLGQMLAARHPEIDQTLTCTG